LGAFTNRIAYQSSSQSIIMLAIGVSKLNYKTFEIHRHGDQNHRNMLAYCELLVSQHSQSPIR